MNEAIAKKQEKEAASFEDVVLAWWRAVLESPADRAALRRCATAAEVALLPAYHRLRRDLAAAEKSVGAERLAVICAVLSHVRVHDGGASFAQQLTAGEGDKARFSGLRFRRLLAMPSGDELLAGLVRAARILDGRANVADLARAIRFWGDNERLRWARDYYDARPQEA
ncbi:MAG: type I-E CRISPR-associated protein Cse2/CasB [Myxococcales bacterium]|jgi:CRISPR type I-E-associated protein CasB/Cse2